MTRKVTDGPIRNKERTKANLINAVRKILKKEGFPGLNITKVADEAKVDRRLIYDYFGGLEGLVHAYLSEKDYWKINSEDIGEIVEANRSDAGKALTFGVLEDQFDSLMSSEEMRQIITWGLSEKLSTLKELDLKREKIGDEIFGKLMDGYFKNTDKNFRAIYALLMGGVYYISLHSNMQENPFCGIDVQQPEGKAEIKNALKQLIDFAYA
jgi:hypothetical protein